MWWKKHSGYIKNLLQDNLSQCFHSDIMGGVASRIVLYIQRCTLRLYQSFEKFFQKNFFIPLDSDVTL